MRSGRAEKACPICGAVFYTKKARQFCSTACYGKHRSETYRGENHPTFRPVPDYEAVHKWAQAKWTKTGRCEYCNESGLKTQWANLDGYYSRDEAAWAELCPSCHQFLDGRNGVVEKTQLWLEHMGSVPWG